MDVKKYFGRGSDSYSTPSEIYEFFMSRGAFDPCPLDDNGCGALFVNWTGFNYLNPPYSDPKPFVDKAILYKYSCGAVSVFLVPNRTDSKWFQLLASECSLICFLNKRLCFGDRRTQAPFGSVFCVVAPCEKREVFFCSLDSFFCIFKRRYLWLFKKS